MYLSALYGGGGAAWGVVLITQLHSFEVAVKATSINTFPVRMVREMLSYIGAMPFLLHMCKLTKATHIYIHKFLIRITANLISLNLVVHRGLVCLWYNEN